MSSDSIPLLRKRPNNKDSDDVRENMDEETRRETDRKYLIVYGVATALGTIILIMVLVWLILYGDGFGFSTSGEYFCWHPLLMIFGFIFCYSQAMLIFRTGRNLQKYQLKLIHMVLNMSALILAILGITAAFASHAVRKPPTPDLYSLHSWIGITTVILFALQFIIGFTAFLFPGYSPAQRASLMPVHTAIGAAIFVCAIAAAVSGTTEKAIFTLGRQYQDLPSEGMFLNFIGYLLAIFG
ncbi:hypothetical protein AMK59_4044, partial [Oryctes borbonicus]